MKKQLILATVLGLFSSLVFAHPGHGFASGLAGGFESGFIHPLTGWDHLLVMLAVGVWAAKLGGKARWQLPATFMVVMALGACLGMSGMAYAGIETAIAASVMAMGLLLIITLPLNAALQIGLTAVFALMHGIAHGVELNQGATPLLGMLFATGLLHAAGLLISAQRFNAVTWMRTSLAWGMMLVGGYWLVVG